MTLSGSRGLLRVAQNPDCELQAAMALARVRETEVYQALAGAPFPGEYGERVSARRRGAQFERHLFEDGASLLRETLAPLLGTDAAALTVLDLATVVPGTRLAAMQERMRRTRAVLSDLAAGRAVPDLIIQPQLCLPIGDTQHILIAPDALVLDRTCWMYVPVEIKSFIVRDGIVGADDRGAARRQAAVEIAALRAELVPHGMADRVAERAIFVFATPFGLRPHPAFEEQLPAELADLRRALDVLVRVSDVLGTVLSAGRVDAHMFATVAPRLTFAYVEGCIASCALAALCRKRAAGQAAVLGDAVADALGRHMSVSRAVALLGGDPPADEREARLQAALRDAAALLATGHQLHGVPA